MKTINFKNNLIKSAIAVIVILSCVSYSYAAVPHLISYQGRLSDKDGKVLDGTYSITLKIYDAVSNGNLLWEETYTKAAVTKGIFAVSLGSITKLDLAFDKQYYLEISVDGVALSPRHQLSSTGYAYRSEVSDNGCPKGAIIMYSGTISSIPSGWALCDGTNGTPDLRDKFAAGSGALPQTGGTAQVTLTVENMPSHRHYSEHKHSVDTHTHTTSSHRHPQTPHKHPIGGGVSSGSVSGFQAEWQFNRRERTLGSGGGGIATGSAGDNETSSATGETGAFGEYYTSYEGSGGGITNLPPYYALAFIMKL